MAAAWLKIPAFNGNIDTQSDNLWFLHNAATRRCIGLEKYDEA